MPDAGTIGELDNPLDQLLAFIVPGMGFAGKNKLHRPGGGIDHGLQPLRVGQQQGRPLVGGEAAGENNRQDVLVKHRFGKLHHRCRGVALAVLFDHQPAAGVDQAGAAHLVGVPQLFVVDLVDFLGDVVFTGMQGPVGAEIIFEKIVVPMGDPGSDVDAVGDMGNGYFRFRSSRPDVGPHAAGNLAVEFADPVAVLGHAQSENKHGKRAVGAGSRRLAPGNHFVGRGAQSILQGFKIGLDQLGREFIMAGGNRGVGGEDGGPGHDFQGGFQVDLVSFHAVVQPLQAAKGRMAFVHVAHLWPDFQRFQGPHAANAQKNFLGQPYVGFAAVQPGGDFPDFR